MITLPNVQPIEKQSLIPGDTLDVVKVFRTIQGEGPYVGRPSVFVRMAGCNLQCPLCDTDYTTDRKRYFPQDLAEIILSAMDNHQDDLIVWTGGEPFRQDIRTPIQRLGQMGVYSQIETNGTLLIEPFPFAYAKLVISPKTARIHAGFGSAQWQIDRYFKYIVDAESIDPYDGLPTSVLGNHCRVARPPSGFPRTKIYVQPADEQDPEKNKRNMDAAVASCLKFGYRLCLQMHKIAGLE